MASAAAALPPSPLEWLRQQVSSKAKTKPVKTATAREQAIDDPVFQLAGAGLLSDLQAAPLPPGDAECPLSYLGGPETPLSGPLMAQLDLQLQQASSDPALQGAEIVQPILTQLLAQGHAQHHSRFLTPTELGGDDSGLSWFPLLSGSGVSEQLYEPRLPPVQHELRLARSGVSGRVTGFKEVIRPHQDSATKSTSLGRALARDDTSAQLPFLPGGLDPNMIRRRREQKLQTAQASASVDVELVQHLVRLMAGPDASSAQSSGDTVVEEDPVFRGSSRLLAVPQVWKQQMLPPAPAMVSKPLAATSVTVAQDQDQSAPSLLLTQSRAQAAGGDGAVIKAHLSQSPAAGAMVLSTLPSDQDPSEQDFIVTKLNRDQRQVREDKSWAKQARDDAFSSTLRQATERAHRQLDSEARLLDRLEMQILPPAVRESLRLVDSGEEAEELRLQAVEAKESAFLDAPVRAPVSAALAGVDQMLEGSDSESPFQQMHTPAASGPGKGGSNWAVLSPLDPETFHEQLPSPAMKFPFPLDTFQRQAILHLERGDPVMVAAHTSAGKTVVAEYAIAFSNRHLSRTLYTSPIKTLSNQKFREFRETFGAKNVGILTGDVTLNPEAPCLILTTEILRSMLYHGADLLRDVGCVIFDEVHYVGDRERGVVWEEVIIMLPEHVNMVFLSATLPNTVEFADWVGRTKQRKVYVVETHKRPVPLQHFMWCGSDKGMFKVRDGDGPFIAEGFRRARAAVYHEQQQPQRHMGRDPQNKDQQQQQQQQSRRNQPAHNVQGKRVAAQVQRHHQGGGGGGNGPRRGGPNQGAEAAQWTSLIQYLKQRDLLPVVVFAFSRKLCENTVRAVRLDLTTSQEKTQIHHFFNQCISRLQGTDRELVQVLELREHLKRGLGVHHAGMLPLLKEVVEMLFARGLVKVLFATETFAMGVNMPAKTVVFHSTQKHDGHGLRPLTPGEYTQMAGRAGRRGLDSVGVVVINCPRDKFPQDSILKQVICGGSTPLQSRFRLSFGMILNLLRQEDLRVEDMIRRSFGESGVSRDEPLRQKQLERARRLLEYIPASLDDLVDDPCEQPGDGGIKDYCDVQDQLGRLRGRVVVQMDPKSRSKWLGAGQMVQVVAPEFGLHDPCLAMVTKPPYVRSEGGAQMGMDEIAEQTHIRVVLLTPEGYVPPAEISELAEEHESEDGGPKFARLSPAVVAAVAAVAPASSAAGGFERSQRHSGVPVVVVDLPGMSGGGGGKKPQQHQQRSRGGKKGGKNNKKQDLDDLFFGGGQPEQPEEDVVATAAAPAPQGASADSSVVAPGNGFAEVQTGRGYWTMSVGACDLVGILKQPTLRWRAANGSPVAAKELLRHERSSGSSSLAKVGRDLGLNKLEHADLDSQLELLQVMLSSNPSRDCSRFQAHWSRAQKRQVVSRVVHRLAQYEGVGENLRLHEEFHQRLHVCELLGYVSPSGRYPDVMGEANLEPEAKQEENGLDQTVVLKGRVACEINTCNPLLLTELIVESVLTPLSAAECVALLSALIYQKSEGPGIEQGAALSTPAVAVAYKQLETIAGSIARTMERCGMDVVVDEWVRENVHPGMMPLVYEWARGMSFKEVCELAGGEIQEGIIVRCINRLEETCRDVRNGARVIGDPVLYTKMQQAQELIRRDIVFAASLYVA